MSTDHARPGLLRLIRAEAREQERTRLLGILDDTARDMDQKAREYGGRRPALSGWGRQARGIQVAAEVLRTSGRSTWANPDADPFSSIAGSCDTVELYSFDPDPADLDGEEEPMPVRVIVVDGADDAAATGYLTLDEAWQLFTDGLQLVDQIRAAREARALLGDVHG